MELVTDPDLVKLTAYSHGAGCGCKISPQVLSQIIGKSGTALLDQNLLIGNDKRDDAAVYKLNEELAIISTTDFFMPIVDDPFDFGGIASVNAISDVYAMGGKPIMAIAILGWPIDKLGPDIAGRVIAGAREACSRAGIPLAGGHSIDTPEPIFGLAVTGHIHPAQVKANSEATVGCELFLTKPLGVGILTTAQKMGLLKDEDLDTARNLMLSLNDIGQDLASIDGVKAMTDVTGFGLLGHLVEMCQGSGLSAKINADLVPRIDNLTPYMEAKTFPGGTNRNYASYGHHIGPITDLQKALLCDPQTSGGLMVAVSSSGKEAFLRTTKERGLQLQSFGLMVEKGKYWVEVS
jgi:selenide,water dikinase